MSTANIPSQLDSSADQFWLGIEQFNQGDYYDCHDTMEAIWMSASTSEKPFYQGILQIAVGLYHLQNHNWRGAAILLGEGSSRLLPFEPAYQRTNVSDLIDQAQDWLKAVQQAGPEQIATVAAQLTTAHTALHPPKIRRASPN
ncbi:MAG: DUF309 domain-containing protein [Cyanobacteria bacterium J06632_22]